MNQPVKRGPFCFQSLRIKANSSMIKQSNQIISKTIKSPPCNIISPKISRKKTHNHTNMQLRKKEREEEEEEKKKSRERNKKKRKGKERESCRGKDERNQPPHTQLDHHHHPI
ncbi:unnamed protein product [Prunus armeniaca]